MPYKRGLIFSSSQSAALNRSPYMPDKVMLHSSQAVTPAALIL